MNDIGFIFAGARFCLCFPDEIAEPVSLLLRDVERADGPGAEKAIEIVRAGPGDSFRIIAPTSQSDLLQGYQHLLETLPSFLKGEIFAALASRCLISGSALEKGGRLILFPASRSSGRSMLGPSLVSNGWRFRLTM